jgi:hypothetical protein
MSYVYSYYMALLAAPAADPSLTMKPFSDMVYEFLLGVYGLRLRAEIVFLDLLFTIKSFLEITMPRIHQFARFLQIVDPLPIRTLHFYLHAVTMMNRSQTGPLFAELEPGESLISGIPTSAACGAAQSIFSRFVKGRTLKFYSERLNKIAGDGMMKFGGKNTAELNEVLDYILSAYIEECAKLEDAVKERFAELPDREIKTFSQFHTMISHLPQKPPHEVEIRMMRQLLEKDRIVVQEFLDILKVNGLNLPFVLSQGDYLQDQNAEDLVKFMHLELTTHLPLFDEIVKKLGAAGDDVTIKQLKSSKAKLDQALSSRSIGRTFQAVQREFYERLFLVQQQIERNAVKE